MGGVSFVTQLSGSLLAVVFALVNSIVVYAVLKKIMGIRLHEEDEYHGADLSIHKIGAYPEDHIRLAKKRLNELNIKHATKGHPINGCPFCG
jgi:Amt family ammonium transporter